DILSGELDGPAMLDRALALAQSSGDLDCDLLLGQLPLGAPVQARVLASIRRLYGRMPWSERRRVLSPGVHTIPVAGDGEVGNPNLPPPSRPEEEDLEIRTDRRVGIPYPEWNFWTKSFLRDHVAVFERKHTSSSRASKPVSADLRRFFEEHTHRV